MMKRYFLLVFLLLPFMGYGQSMDGSVINAGFSEIGITPEKPIPMSGYGNRNDPYKGIHDSVYAQAMYLTQGDEEVLLITSELIGHSHENVNMLKEMIRKEMGIPENRIFVTAVHNHGGPTNSTYGPEDSLQSDVKAYVDVLYDKLLEISVEAKKDAQPVMIGFEKGECKMNINRRAVFSEGEIWLGKDPDGACDHDLSIIKFTDMQGALRAVHVNYPCHGTASGPKNYLITGDWPGISARMMKEKLGGDVIIMVTAGASANINALYGPNDNYRQINAVAYGVASVALDLVEKCNTDKLSGLRASSSTLYYPGKKRWDSTFPQESIPEGEIKLNIAAFRMGDIVMAGVSGELFTEIGMNVKNRIPGNTAIMTHCNGASGYICTDAAFLEGGYEPQVSHLMPGSEIDFENALVELIKEVKE